MSPFSNAFEKTWFGIILFLYIFIMIPFPFFFSTEYQPLFLGIPTFVFGWLIHETVVVGVILLWRHQCMSRPEYEDLGENE